MLGLESQGHPGAVTDVHNVFLPPPYRFFQGGVSVCLCPFESSGLTAVEIEIDTLMPVVC
jgi:hypothetical protein